MQRRRDGELYFFARFKPEVLDDHPVTVQRRGNSAEPGSRIVLQRGIVAGYMGTSLIRNRPPPLAPP